MEMLGRSSVRTGKVACWIEALVLLCYGVTKLYCLGEKRLYQDLRSVTGFDAWQTQEDVELEPCVGRRRRQTDESRLLWAADWKQRRAQRLELQESQRTAAYKHAGFVCSTRWTHTCCPCTRSPLVERVSNVQDIPEECLRATNDGVKSLSGHRAGADGRRRGGNCVCLLCASIE